MVIVLPLSLSCLGFKKTFLNLGRCFRLTMQVLIETESTELWIQKDRGEVVGYFVQGYQMYMDGTSGMQPCLLVFITVIIVYSLWLQEEESSIGLKGEVERISCVLCGSTACQLESCWPISLGRKWEVGILAGREDSGIESAVGRNSHNDRHGHMNLRRG